MELWFTEKHTAHLALTYQVKETLFQTRTAYQDLAILDTYPFGRMLVLDGVVQTTVQDEFIYHEMIVHPAMTTHPAPRRVLVIGGGDGGTVREVVKYPQVEQVTLVELDKEVISASRTYLPEISSALDHSKLEIIIADGIEFMRGKESVYDIILIDSPDPIGPATNLFSEDFYANVHKALSPRGIVVAQTESPFIHGDLIRRIQGTFRSLYKGTHLYLAHIPTYQHGMWSFSMGTKHYDPLRADCGPAPAGTRYYTRKLHRGAFCLPHFVSQLLVEE